MSVKASVLRGVDAAFNAIGDLKTSFIVRVNESAAYDPITGTVTQTNIDYVVEGVRVRLSDEERIGLPSQTDTMKVIFKQSLLPVQPLTDHRVLVGTDQFEISRVVQDPAGATWTLYIQKASYDEDV